MDQKVAFRNGHINFRDEGKGPALVLLHGFLETLEMWDDFAPKLTGQYRVIRIDLPGHGGSESFGYVHSMEMMAQAVQTVLQSLKIRKCLVVGHSMGGYVTMAIADAFPDLLKGYVLFHSSARADSAARKKDRERGIRLVKENHKRFIRQAIPLLFRHKFRSMYREEINRLKQCALQSVSKRGVVACMEGMKERVNREVILRFTPVPVLFLTGKKDPLFPYESLKPQFTLSEKIEAVCLEEAGHMGFIEERDHALKAIKRFLAGCR